jgi:hypothetical protein
LPFQELAETCSFANYDPIVENFIEVHGLKMKSWVYPQALAHVSQWRISRTPEGKFSGKALIVDNCKHDDFNKGLYWFLLSKHRAIKKQYVETEYCSMVPLILAAFKKYQDIKYSSWEVKELNFVVDPPLLEAMLCVPPEYSKEELLQFRVDGLVTSNTAKRNPGGAKSPVSTYGLNALPKELEDGRAGPAALPSLVRMMLCQTWCAHPSNRNHYMILDPKSWDSVPDALIVDDVLPIKNTTALDSIWQ